MKTLRWGPLLLRYARDRLAHIVLAVACPAVYALVCALAGAPLAGVVYAGALVLAGGLIALCVDLPRYVRRHRELQSLLDGCLYAATVLPAPRGLMEEDWRALLLCAIDQSAGQADATTATGATVRPASPCGRIRSRCRWRPCACCSRASPAPPRTG